MSKKRTYGERRHRATRPKFWRLRYRIGGKVFRRTLPGHHQIGSRQDPARSTTRRRYRGACRS